MVRLVDDVAYLVVDLLGHFLAIVALLGDLTAQEDHLLLAAEGARAQVFAHAPLGDHLARQAGDFLQVVLGTRGRLVERQLLGRHTAEESRQHVLELGLGVQVAVFLRQEAGEAAGHAAGDDAYLVGRVRLREQVPYQGVSGLVVSDDLPFSLADNATLPLRAGDDAVYRLVELRHRHFLLAAPRGQDAALVHQVGEVGAGEAGSLLGDDLQADAAVQGLALGVDLKDRLPALDVRLVQHYLTVEAAGAQQRRV